MNKKVTTGIILSVVLLIMIIAVSYFTAPKKVEVLDFQDPQLTSEGRTIQEQRLDAAKKLVSEINDQTSRDDKFDRQVALAIAYSNLGMLKESRDAYREALDTKSDHASAWHMYSSLLTGMRDYDNALKAIQKAIELDPTNPEYWTWRIALEKDYFAGTNEKLNGIYVDALLKTDNNVDIITAYAVFLEGSGNLQAAKEYWQKAVGLNSTGKVTYETEIKRLDDLMKQRGL